MLQYFSDLSDDMRMFFMDKVEKELRESSEYSDMLDALGRTLDTVREAALARLLTWTCTPTPTATLRA